MSEISTIVVGAGPDGQPVGQAMRLANRHGLVAGATGTGKTVTLQHLAETFSDAGSRCSPPMSKVTFAAWALLVRRRARWPSASPACPGCSTGPRLTR